MERNNTLDSILTRQRDQSDCGVSCLLTLVNYYGGENTLEELRVRSGTSQQGTTLLGLYQAANSIGFEAQGCQSDLEGLIAHSKPCILHVIINDNAQHFVVCFGFRNNQFVIGDPSEGIQFFSKENLNKIWVSKNCLILQPNDSFQEKSQIAKEKRNWFINILKEDYQLLGISIGLGLGVAILSMTMAIFSQKLIDDILPSEDLDRLVTGIILLGFLLLVRVGLSALRSYFLITQTKDFNNRIINKFYSALMYLPKTFFDTRKIGDMVARLNDTNRIQNVIKHVASNFVIDMLIASVSLGFLYYYSWKVGIIATLSLPLYFMLIFGYNKKIINAQKEVMQNYALTESNYITSISGVSEIKNYNRQPVFQNLNRIVYGNFQNSVFNLGKINMFLGLWSGLAAVLFLVSILAYTSYMVFMETMLLGELMAVLGISGSLLPSVANLALISIPINEGKIAFSRMFEFANIEKENSGDTIIEKFDSIKLENVSFRFAGRKPLLKQINIAIEKNEIVALVGESGSGKSTIGQIVQKSFSIESGNIILNGQHSINQINYESWRHVLGVVPQEITVFSGNVLDNILFGAKEEPERVVDFCKKYGFEKFFMELPQGYATTLGEEGINLSGGQKQIIALARVLFKKPQFLILDEATSAMDGETEEFALNLLKKLKNDMAILFISHRLHILKALTDKIYVLNDGLISANGSHNTLMKTSNIYSKYWNRILSDTA